MDAEDNIKLCVLGGLAFGGRIPEDLRKILKISSHLRGLLRASQHLS